MTITEIFLAILGGITLGSIASVILSKYFNSRLNVPKLDVEKEKVSKTFRTSGGDSIQIL